MRAIAVVSGDGAHYNEIRVGLANFVTANRGSPDYCPLR